MNKIVPCKFCTDRQAKAGKQVYVLNRVPSIFASAGARLHFRCSGCGKRGEISRSEFNSIPDTVLTVVE